LALSHSRISVDSEVVMRASELFDAGALRRAVEAQTRAVKDAPADPDQRLFLVELLCFDGQWDRAGRHCEAIYYDQPEQQAALHAYRNVLHAERFRRQLFGEGGRPEFLTEPPPHVLLRLEALEQFRDRRPEEAARLLRQANDASLTLH